MANADREFSVLFLCTCNSARSVMAEAILNRAGAGRFKAYSAGSEPVGKVDPTALDVLRNLEYDTSGLRSKSWEEFAGDDAPEIDFVFTLCDDAANEPFPEWPGEPMFAHWGLPDCAHSSVPDTERHAMFFETCGMLKHRIESFISLPFASLDKLALHTHLHAIGKTSTAAAA